MEVLPLVWSFSEIINWWGWSVATGELGIILVMEILRFRLSLTSEYKAARRVSAIIIYCRYLLVFIFNIEIFYIKSKYEF